jgi:hypothetical protein
MEIGTPPQIHSERFKSAGGVLMKQYLSIDVKLSLLKTAIALLLDSQSKTIYDHENM